MKTGKTHIKGVILLHSFWVALLIILFTASCVYMPKTVTVYDEDCEIYARHMELEKKQIAQAVKCENMDCLAFFVSAGIVSSTTAIVSGSVVVAGNVIYWYEKQGQCKEEG